MLHHIHYTMRITHPHAHCVVDVVGACPFRGTFNFTVTVKQQSNSIICYGGMKNNKSFKKKMTPFFSEETRLLDVRLLITLIELLTVHMPQYLDQKRLWQRHRPSINFCNGGYMVDVLAYVPGGGHGRCTRAGTWAGG